MRRIATIVSCSPGKSTSLIEKSRLPPLSPEQEQRLAQIAEKCPVHHPLRTGVHVRDTVLSKNHANTHQ